MKTKMKMKMNTKTTSSLMENLIVFLFLFTFDDNDVIIFSIVISRCVCLCFDQRRASNLTNTKKMKPFFKGIQLSHEKQNGQAEWFLLSVLALTNGQCDELLFLLYMPSYYLLYRMIHMNALSCQDAKQSMFPRK